MRREQAYKELETLVEGLCLKDDEQLTGCVSRAQALIAMNLELNPKSASYSLLGRLCEVDDQEYKTRMAARKIVRMLLKAGANPLINTQEALAVDDDTTVPIMIKHLITMENKGKPLKTQDGGNLLHLMADENPSRLVDILHSARPQNEGQVLIHPAWINEKNENGQAPVHCLFSSNSVFGRALDSGDDQSTEAYIEDIWSNLDQMLSLGLDLGAEDANGESAAQMIVRLYDYGLELEDNEIAERTLQTAQAFMEQKQLQAATPGVTRVAARRSRL